MTHYFSQHAKAKAREHKWRMNAKRANAVKRTETGLVASDEPKDAKNPACGQYGAAGDGSKKTGSEKRGAAN
jgi:hypothetical protein